MGPNSSLTISACSPLSDAIANRWLSAFMDFCANAIHGRITRANVANFFIGVVLKFNTNIVKVINVVKTPLKIFWILITTFVHNYN